MALPASILTLTKDIQAAFMRHGNVYLISEDGLVAATLGRIKAPRINFEPLETEMDSTGRASLMGYTVNGEFTMMQTDAEALSAVPDLAAPAAGTDGDNGYKVFFTDTPLAAAAAVTAWNEGDDATQGTGIIGAILIPKPAIDFGGGESGIPVTFTGRIRIASLAGFGTSRKITFDS